MTHIVPTAEPFLFIGGNVGCLLAHGFTGSPKEMRLLGEHLSDQGYTVLGVRLFGHATRIEDMRRARWRDWLAGLEGGYHMLRENCREIIAIGLSMGGSLSLCLAAQVPLAGVISMSAPALMPNDPRLPLISLLSVFIRDVKKGPPNWQNLELRKDHFSYPSYPTRAVRELRDLLSELRRSLPEVTIPALIIHSRGDRSVSPPNADLIFKKLGSEMKEIIWIEKSGHVITRDAQRDLVFGHISAFLQRIAGDEH